MTPKKKQLCNTLFLIVLNCLFWALLVCLTWYICGCSWQGQKHQEFGPSGKLKINSEWWSMRAAWVSSGIESYTETPFYKSGANIQTSKTDPNAVEAVVTGIVLGMKGL